MKNVNLQGIPKFEDSWSYLYFEKGMIDQHQKSIGFHYLDRVVPVPIETLCLLMLGPGTSITHEAIKRISESRCLLAWTGEMGIRFYSSGYSGTYSAKNLLRQIEVYSNEDTRLGVARSMYQKRFIETVSKELSIEQLRGLEGIRVRRAYEQFSQLYSVEWDRRDYDQSNWDFGNPINRALSSANACLYGVVHAAILACGFSPAIGFVHTGKQLSFVYDIADLYKTETSIPVAFQVVSESHEDVERRVRYTLRDLFKEQKLMKRIIPDLKDLMYGSDYAGEIDPFSEGRDVAVSY
ncbi:MAG: type I-E CRISPR-associated endonuclease Cas1 [Bacteroidia bacterium]|nr:type I-E CRISPR-associated endonuclease Cas1e [uncultured Sphaerochaeta sp.]NCB97007.1 type I-E CRISPR-associated endonuclease Cas1 [Bacteroidia bacterium]NCC88763.1 type I-E CRISPR-associated endonuclease Cas1 [Spirochaetia bacterium]